MLAKLILNNITYEIQYDNTVYIPIVNKGIFYFYITEKFELYSFEEKKYLNKGVINNFKLLFTIKCTGRFTDNDEYKSEIRNEKYEMISAIIEKIESDKIGWNRFKMYNMNYNNGSVDINIQ